MHHDNCIYSRTKPRRKKAKRALNYFHSQFIKPFCKMQNFVFCKLTHPYTTDDA